MGWRPGEGRGLVLFLFLDHDSSRSDSSHIEALNIPLVLRCSISSAQLRTLFTA
jgi:hypothetical protein